MKKRTRLKIIILAAANYARGGIRIQIEHANRLAGRGHDVTILSAYPPPDWIELAVPWQEISVPQGTTLGHQLPPADIVMFSFYEQAWTLYDRAAGLSAAPVYFAQGDEYLFGEAERAESELERNNIRAAQMSLQLPFPLLTVSSSAKNFINKHGAKDVTVIPNGIDLDRFRPVPEKNNQRLRVLSVGSEKPSFKGIQEIYAVLMKLQQDPQCPPFTFVRASPAFNALESLPIPVEFHQNPSQEKLAELYATSDLFIGASHLESFYLLPLEAMASGTAVVCSDLPAVRDYAKPQRDFLPFPPGNLGSMFEMVKFALLSNRTRKQLAENGLQAARAMDWDEIIRRVEEYCYTIAGQRDRILTHLARHKKLKKISFSISRNNS